jgi:hypothetical protein
MVSHSTARLSLRTGILKAGPDKTEKQESKQLNETGSFRPRFVTGLVLSWIGNDLGSLPSGISLREARFKILEIGPLHNFLEKRWSEPVCRGYLEGNRERTLTKCQEDFLLDTRTITNTSLSTRRARARLRLPKSIRTSGPSPGTHFPLNP